MKGSRDIEQNTRKAKHKQRGTDGHGKVREGREETRVRERAIRGRARWSNDEEEVERMTLNVMTRKGLV